ncbi:MAG: hypothetical protein KAH38_06255, partial [Candidatus Hydrogenedentes bacterium]|nr:hypothetical protein [Candidatus Hydrogenedentota bacterium]
TPKKQEPKTTVPPESTPPGKNAEIPADNLKDDDDEKITDVDLGEEGAKKQASSITAPDDASTDQQQEQGKKDLVPDVKETKENVSRGQRPLWLVVLWSATLALISAYVLYVYILDPILNPF